MGSHTTRLPRRRSAGRIAQDIHIQTVLDGIRFIVHRLRTSSREAERRIGLSAAQLFVLQQISEHDDLSINDLAARTYTHQSSVSVVVSRLVRRGLARRRPAPGDARRSALSLSDKGRRLLAVAPETTQTDIIHALKRLPDRRRREFAQVMRQMTHFMGAGRGRAVMFFDATADKDHRAK